jgi:hypothetical protein
LRAFEVLGIAAVLAVPFAAARSATGVGFERVEARSNELLAVGVVHQDRMIIHVSRLADNAPLRDAAVSVVLRGTRHPATADTDGSYTLQTADLALPGAAAVEFEVTRGQLHDSLRGTLDVAAAAGHTDEKSNARQLWWWVLNFAVCIGFLWLISRRKKASQS